MPRGSRHGSDSDARVTNDRTTCRGYEKPSQSMYEFACSIYVGAIHTAFVPVDGRIRSTTTFNDPVMRLRTSPIRPFRKALILSDLSAFRLYWHHSYLASARNGYPKFRRKQSRNLITN